MESLVFNDVDFESLCARLHHLLHDLNIFLVKSIKCLITHFPLVEVGFLHPVNQLNDLNELITADVPHWCLCFSTFVLDFWRKVLKDLFKKVWLAYSEVILVEHAPEVDIYKLL